MEKGKTYPLCALLGRMKYINRWGLMRASRTETLSEHVAEAAIIAHQMALVATEILGDDTIRPQQVAVAALYHDASEILTGDMPTPVKYNNPQLKSAYKALEHESALRLAAMAPPQLQPALEGYLTGSALNENEAKLLKAADRLSALIKCIEEEGTGNKEFSSAKAQQLALLKGMDCPAADYFIEHFLPCYERNLDELSRSES